MNDIKILFFDIDGTLLDPATGAISPKTRETLRRLRENGKLVCIATGRPPASLPQFGDLEFDMLCTSNGCLCYTETETIFTSPIPLESAKKIIANSAAIGRPVSVAVRDRLVANGIEQDLADYYTSAGLVLTVAEDFDEVCQNEDIYQIMMGCREADHPTIIRDVENVRVVFSWYRAADVISSYGGKGNGIRNILKHYQLDASQAVAFGDSFNDIDMLQAVGTGVAMGNAMDRLKAVADDVCGSVSEDGIYHYCLQHGLI